MLTDEELSRLDVRGLLTTIDVLWGFMPVAQVRQIKQDHPEIELIAVMAHDIIWHRGGPDGEI